MRLPWFRHESRRCEIRNVIRLKQVFVPSGRYDNYAATRNVCRPHSGIRWVVFLLAIVGLSLMLSTSTALAAPPAQDSSEVTGEATFGQICGACHTIGGGIRIGPDLQGVTERREDAWLKVHIWTPSIHHQQNDPISVANREEIGLPMPDLGLSEPEVEAVIAYLKTTTTASPVTPALYVPTLAAGVLAIVALTIFGLSVGRKRVEVRS